MHTALPPGQKEAYAFFKFPFAFKFHDFVELIQDVDEDPLNYLGQDILKAIHGTYESGFDGVRYEVSTTLQDESLKATIDQHDFDRALGSFIHILASVIHAQLPYLPIWRIKSLSFSHPSTFSIMVIGEDKQIAKWFNHNPHTRTL